MVDYRIPRSEIYRVFPDPKNAAAFERMQRNVEINGESTAAAVAATDKLNEAAFVTLSANAELPNERVLLFGPGIVSEVTDTTLTIAVDETFAGGSSSTLAIDGGTASNTGTPSLVLNGGSA